MFDYKGYNIVKTAPAGMLAIKYVGKGGSLPEVLRGMYTGINEAKRAVDAYLSIKVESKKDDKQPVTS